MSDPAVASTAEIRASFPALERLQEGRPVAYFDGPGGTQVPRSVVEAVADYLTNHNANTHWSFPTSRETDRILSGARRALGDFLGASPEEVAFGANMTSLTFHLARSLGRGWGPGDEVVVTELDHHANVDPWLALERERGLTIRVARMIPETGETDFEDLAGKINGQTRLVAIGAASNALGTISDVAEAARLAHDVGALAFVDAVHYAPHRLVDVEAMSCDFLACSAYKFHGPHVGVLYGRKDLLQGLDVPKLKPSPDTAPERLETGTQNHEGIAGAAAAVEFLSSIAQGPTRRARLQAAFDALHRRGQALTERLWDGLAGIEGVRAYGPPPSRPRTPTVSFTVDGLPSGEVARRLSDRGLFVSHGDFYATTAVERLGLADEGLVRIGCACYTTEDEIERLLDEVRGAARGQEGRRPGSPNDGEARSNRGGSRTSTVLVAGRVILSGAELSE
ncbi:cysteine desulfurase-like protein [Tundrisphaera lichenicola]|uniref:cysteine desulfurase-like protein n=1 Tax=Tundrisphaera lichenicola TaxID=2029860 RepID=UPI003EC144BB